MNAGRQPFHLYFAAIFLGLLAAGRGAYVAPDQFDFEQLLGAPPADDSARHRQELDRMLSLQADRTPAEERRCKSEETISVFAFSDVLGGWFNAKDLPVTSELMQQVQDQVKAVADVAKDKWKRVRPPLADRRIHPCVKLERSPSYPSSHATRGIVWATLLCQIFPERTDALMARGKQIGDDRVLGGMHYPTDVAAGQKLGAEIARLLLANPDFQSELRKSRAECLAAKPIPAQQ